MTGMRAKLLVAGSALLFGLASPQAQASDTDIFASCDGLGKPGKSAAYPTGYRSDIVVRFLDTDARNTRALDAKTIIDSLGPYYYKDDKR